MKRCPTCNRTFTDPDLIYCVEDGTPLSTEEPAYVPPRTLHEKRSGAFPWVLAFVAAFGLGVIALLVVAFLVVPRFTKSVERNTADHNTETTNAPPEHVDVPPPTDKDEVLAQLTQIENDWTAANLSGDRQKLARILADDYVDPSSPDGGLRGKVEYLNTTERDDRVEKWDLYDLSLQLAGNRATLTGGITYVVEGDNVSYTFTDRFVWRNGRWQATRSDTQRKE